MLLSVLGEWGLLSTVRSTRVRISKASCAVGQVFFEFGESVAPYLASAPKAQRMA